MRDLGYFGKDTPSFEYIVSAAYYDLLNAEREDKVTLSLMGTRGLVIYTTDPGYDIKSYADVLVRLKIPFKFYKNTWREDFLEAMEVQYGSLTNNFNLALGTPLYTAAENNDLLRKSLLGLAGVQK